MSKSSSSKTSRVAQFISRRIDELRPRRSQLEIATAAGFSSANMLSMIKDGTSKLPMERVVPLAKALECDPVELVRLALEQIYPQEVLATIFAAANQQTKTPGPDVTAWAIALGVELRVALHDVKFAQQFARSSVSRTERIEARLERINVALDEMLIATRTSGALLKHK